MQDIKQREVKMQETNKNREFKMFVRDIMSWFPIVLQKNNGYISRYPQTPRIKEVVHYKEYERVKDMMTDYGGEYDDTISFFDNYRKLFQSIPFPNLVNVGSTENADFCDTIAQSSNSYLGFNIITDCTNVLYGVSVKDHSSTIINSNVVWDNSESVYMSNGIMKSFGVFYSRYIYNCSNVRFSSNLTGCHECVLCNDLENLSYCIQNKQYSPQEYLKEKNILLSQKDNFSKRSDAVNKRGENIGSTDAQGSFNLHSEDVKQGYYTYQVKNGKNLMLVGGAKGNKNMYNVCAGGSVRAEDIYGAMGVGVNTSNAYCNAHVSIGSNIYYSYYLENCSYCLGCVGLRNKSFCILNKQYTQEEWFELANKIFENMDKDGTLGQFFPGSMNPFYFNDTAASLIDDRCTKEEVIKAGYMRRNEEIKVDVPVGAEMITTKELNNFQGFNEKGEWQINPEILKRVIKDEKGNYYRIVSMELEFLQKHGLPLPDIHRLERIKLGFKFK